jgi:RNA polymerase sigma factor (sigma-70 family)
MPLEPPRGEGSAEVVLSAEELHAREMAEEAELTAAFLRHSRWLHAYVRTWVRREEVDDVVQEVHIGAWKKKMVSQCGGNDGRIQAYLRRTVRNCVFNAQRQNKRKREKFARVVHWVRTRFNDPESAAQRAIASELEHLLAEAIAELPPHYHDVFFMVRVEHKSHKEVAEVLNMKETTVDVYVRRAARRVQKYLAARGYGRDPDSRGKKEDTP